MIRRMSGKWLAATGGLMMASALLLQGCASVPTGPDVAVMPGPGKPLSEFQREDARCRHFAEHSVSEQPSHAAANKTAEGAAIGAAAGAGLGAVATNHGRGAAVGAVIGLITGTMVGASNGEYAQSTLQRRYDTAYEQCMYTYGNQVPGARVRAYRPPPAAYPPPPPGG